MLVRPCERGPGCARPVLLAPAACGSADSRICGLLTDLQRDCQQTAEVAVEFERVDAAIGRLLAPRAKFLHRESHDFERRHFRQLVAFVLASVVSVLHRIAGAG